ncbi:MAG: dTDP-4-dehydrorhamnose 3,5-epimerase [Nitrososphaerota archaeon]
MRFIETELKGAFIIEPEPAEDHRGFFARIFCEEEFRKHGIDFKVVQCNISFNKRKGTLRGMHFQAPPYEEAKLVRCIKGAIYDVIIDLRRESPTFKKWIAVLLRSYESSLNMADLPLCLKPPAGSMLYIPKGFAHGFQTLEDDTEIFYFMSEFYHPEYASGVRWNDPAFGIKWPISEIIISDKDKSYTNFNPKYE